MHANAQTGTFHLPARISHDKLRAKLPNQHDGLDADGHATTGKPDQEPERLRYRRLMKDTSTRSERTRKHRNRSASDGHAISPMKFICFSFALNGPSKKKTLLDEATARLMKFATTDHNQEATLYHTLKDVSPREKPFIKAPILKDPARQIFKAPKENTPLLNPKRKLRLIRSLRTSLTSIIKQTARSPIQLLLPLLPRFTIRRSTLRRRTESSPGCDSAFCRSSQSARWPSTQEAPVPTLATTTIEVTTRSRRSTTRLPLLLITTTVLATMLLLTFSSQH